MNPLLPPAHLDADGIVRASKSSFLPAFLFLPADRRCDLQLFYALCHAIDDIADAAHCPATLRHEALQAWRSGFHHPNFEGLPGNVAGLMLRRSLDRGLFLELLEGVATDLASPVRMPARADLDLYCHRVAGTVGCLCLPIFGAHRDRATDYAETLGRALQYTNILRDTASDLRRGRIYYPLDELAASGISIDSFPDGAAAYLARFTEETENLFQSAERKLPIEDRKALTPARVMASIYRTLLRKMRRDGLRVAEKRYRLSTAEKVQAIVTALFARQ